MTRTISATLITLGLAACANQPGTEVDTRTVPIPDRCTTVHEVWKLKVKFKAHGPKDEPESVVADAGNPRPIPDPMNLVVKECDVVQIRVKNGSTNRSAMVSFDKSGMFESPGKRPAYLTTRGLVFVPIDCRSQVCASGTGKTETYAYSIYVDCPDNDCMPLDPMIIVER